MGLSFLSVVGLTILWEEFEMFASQFGNEETYANRFLDIGLARIGWGLAALLAAPI